MLIGFMRKEQLIVVLFEASDEFPLLRADRLLGHLGRATCYFALQGQFAGKGILCRPKILFSVRVTLKVFNIKRFKETDTVGASNDRICVIRFLAAFHCCRAATISGFRAKATWINSGNTKVSCIT